MGKDQSALGQREWGVDEKIGKAPLLRIRNYSISFQQYDGAFHKSEQAAVRDLSLDVRQGEMVAIVGSSGSGKSLLAHGILGILPYNASSGGCILYRGEELTPERVQALRGREIVLVPQSVAYLDPLMKVEAQVLKGKREAGSKRKLQQLFQKFHLKKETGQLYPFELSGGMTRRVLITTAMMEKPKLVIADEPTPGLQKEVAKQVIQHFSEMTEEGAGVLLITHDLELAVEHADRIVVFYAGMTLEDAPASDFEKEESLRHPYSKALYRAMPKHGFSSIAGSQPYGGEWIGCPFSARCDFFSEKCLHEVPLQKLRNGYVRCVLYETDEEHPFTLGE